MPSMNLGVVVVECCAGGAVIVFGAPMVVCGDGTEAYNALSKIYTDFKQRQPDSQLAWQTWVNNNDVVPRLLGPQDKALPTPGIFKVCQLVHECSFQMVHLHVPRSRGSRVRQLDRMMTIACICAVNQHHPQAGFVGSCSLFISKEATSS